MQTRVRTDRGYLYRIILIFFELSCLDMLVHNITITKIGEGRLKSISIDQLHVQTSSKAMNGAILPIVMLVIRVLIVIPERSNSSIQKFTNQPNVMTCNKPIIVREGPFVLSLMLRVSQIRRLSKVNPNKIFVHRGNIGSQRFEYGHEY